MPRRLFGAGPGYPVSACLLLLASVCLFLPGSQACGICQSKPLVLLLQEDALRGIFYSRSAWLIQFYDSECPNCTDLNPTWEALAQDIKDWRPALKLGAIDCGNVASKKICSDFGITKYPTLKFLKPFSTYAGHSIQINKTEKGPQRLKEIIINLAEKNQKAWWSPDAPLLAPVSEAEPIGSLEGKNVALIFEDEDSYLGREVILDMVQYEDITVRRVLRGNEELESRCKVSTFPSGFLLLNEESCRPIPLEKISRSLYTGFLRTYPGVKREICFEDPELPSTEIVNRTKVSMPDLESAVLCSLKGIELRFFYLDGERFSALKQFVNVLAKYFPEDSVVHNYLHNLDVWLKSVGMTNVTRSEWKEGLRAAKESLNANLPEIPARVTCQEISPGLDSYSCSLWKLFHMLSVQEALKSDGNDSPSEVLASVREFMKKFYGCPERAKRFESLAKSMDQVKNKDEAILWLWTNFPDAVVKDPESPKFQWPPQDLCPSCNEIVNGEHKWNEEAVLSFLKKYFSLGNTSLDLPN